jgi:hypothetical protein
MTHTAKNSSGEVLTFKSTTDSSGELRPSIIVDSLSTAQFGAVGDSTVAPGSQGSLLALQRSLLSQVASGITLQPSTAQIGDVGLKARGAGGLSMFYLHSAGDQNMSQVKTTSGTVYGWTITNASAAAYFKLYDVTATGGLTTAGHLKHSVRLFASAESRQAIPHGLAFASGIALALVAGGATNSTVAVGASDIDVNLYYA